MQSLIPVYTKAFNKDIKKLKKSKKNFEKFRFVAEKLIVQEKLEIKHRDHKLSGNFLNRRECHIEPDWLLIYKIDGDYIIFERTGTHSDLF
ncbi:MAG: type II toxin-antitoxin system YafQ family toxin [Ignavibacteria bacterium]